MISSRPPSFGAVPPASPAGPELATLLDRVGRLEDILTDLSARRFPSIESKIDGLNELLGRRRRDHYTVEQVAELVARSEYTVRRWIAEGHVRAIRIAEGGPRGRLLIARGELERLIAAGKGPNVPEVALD